jgi:hypothetical protein
MPLYLPDDPEFAALEARHRWFESVLLATFGELTTDDDPPEALDWLELLPAGRRLDIEEVECSLAFVADDGYTATVWDATGDGDDPWAVFLIDDFGPRLLAEYSVFDEDADDAARDAVLAHASEALPERLLLGALTRTGTPVPIPAWLAEPEPRDIEAAI